MFACDAYHFETRIYYLQPNAIDAVAKERSQPPDLAPVSRQSTSGRPAGFS